MGRVRNGRHERLHVVPVHTFFLVVGQKNRELDDTHAR